jgi:hypothetical protein
MSEVVEISRKLKAIVFLLTVVPWVFGGLSLYEITRAISCTVLLREDSSAHLLWCSYISWDFRPDRLLLTPGLVAVALLCALWPRWRKSSGIRYCLWMWFIMVMAYVARVMAISHLPGVDRL